MCDQISYNWVYGAQQAGDIDLGSREQFVQKMSKGMSRSLYTSRAVGTDHQMLWLLKHLRENLPRMHDICGVHPNVGHGCPDCEAAL